MKARETNYKRGISWLSPEGKFYFADSHTIDAAFIARDILGIEIDDDDIFFFMEKDWAGILINLGWIKLTNSLLFDYYKDMGLYNKMTNDQAESFDKWYNYHFNRG